MKCIQYEEGKVVRVSDEHAYAAVRLGEAKIVPKSVWKKKRETKKKNK